MVEAEKPFQLNQKLHYIHGVGYDLSKFINEHPGGPDVLKATQGRDCTVMFESSHAPYGMEKSKKLLESLGVARETIKDYDPMFTFKENGAYHEIIQETKEMMKANKFTSHKSPYIYWLVVLVVFLIDLVALYNFAFRNSFIGAMVYGLSTVSLGFMVFHTAGHRAVSKQPWLNSLLFFIIGDIMIGFFSKIWDGHHNYAHHSFTNILRKDPDINNALLFVRKHSGQKVLPFHKFQKWLSYVVYILFPGQWVGQVLQYFMVMKRKRIFGMPCTPRECYVPQGLWFIGFYSTVALVSLYYFGVLRTLWTIYGFFLVCNYSYWALVFPNHDVDEVEQTTIAEATKNKMDWGEHQIRSSGNFKAPTLLTWLMGGMNYQIEHHLFPSVHVYFYPMISEIVKRKCRKFNIPYVQHETWAHAAYSNYKKLKSLTAALSTY